MVPKFTFALLLLVTGLKVLELASISHNNVCSTQSGTSFRADPTNCNCYYKCSQAFYQVHLCCENFLHFNPLTQGCDLPENANCTAVGLSKDKSGTELTSEKPPAKADYELCFEGIGFYIDPLNISCYYHCDANSYAHHRCCATTLIYNPEIRGCDW